MRTIHGLLIGLTVIVAACTGGTISPRTAPASVAPSESAAPASVAPSAAASSSAAPGTVDLPAECVESIKGYLVAVEPIVKDVQWATMTGTPPQIEDQLADVAATVDPEVCPELSVTQAHDAWVAIASEVAPGTVDYIDFVYRP